MWQLWNQAYSKMKNKKSVTLSKIFFFVYDFSFRIKENCFIPKTKLYVLILFTLFHFLSFGVVCVWVSECVCVCMFSGLCAAYWNVYSPRYKTSPTYTHKHTGTQYRSLMNIRCVSSVDVYFFWCTVSHWEVGFLSYAWIPGRRTFGIFWFSPAQQH